MTGRGFRRIALGLKGAVEGVHMGHPDFRVNNRIFATLRHGDTLGMVVLTPEAQQSLIRQHPEAFTSESGAWGQSGCTRVLLDSVSEDALGEALTLAWQNIASRTSASPSGASRGAKTPGKRVRRKSRLSPAAGTKRR